MCPEGPILVQITLTGLVILGQMGERNWFYWTKDDSDLVNSGDPLTLSKKCQMVFRGIWPLTQWGLTSCCSCWPREPPAVGLTWLSPLGTWKMCVFELVSCADSPVHLSHWSTWADLLQQLPLKVKWTGRTQLSLLSLFERFSCCASVHCSWCPEAAWLLPGTHQSQTPRMLETVQLFWDERVK